MVGNTRADLTAAEEREDGFRDCFIHISYNSVIDYQLANMHVSWRE